MEERIMPRLRKRWRIQPCYAFVSTQQQNRKDAP